MFGESGVPSGTTILGPNGEHLIISLVNLAPTVMTPYGPVATGSDYYLQEWNSSQTLGQ